MKFKLFVVEENFKLLEQQVNDWLKKNENITICASKYEIRESYNPERGHVNAIHTCNIWYDIDMTKNLTSKEINDILSGIPIELPPELSSKPSKRRLEKLNDDV